MFLKFLIFDVYFNIRSTTLYIAHRVFLLLERAEIND
jgi:hypothetical protein